jgi:putative SOS response-associated peptidase YedK
MCGRFVIELTPELVRKVFGVTGDFPDWPARYNIAPTQLIPVVRDAPDGNRRLAMLRWGLVPSWAKEFGEGQINARCETVNEKPSFRQAFRQRRCIVPASGFYEWTKTDGRKLPYYVRMLDGSPMPLAGIWEAWKAPEGQVVESCAILTTSANATVAAIHERMPVILHPTEFGLWLDRQTHDAECLAPLFAPFPAESIEAFRVSTEVNNVAHDSPECIQPT